MDANPYDQFDTPTSGAGTETAANPYDQFDAPASEKQGNPYDQFDTEANPSAAQVAKNIYPTALQVTEQGVANTMQGIGMGLAKQGETSDEALKRIDAQTAIFQTKRDAFVKQRNLIGVDEMDKALAKLQQSRAAVTPDQDVAIQADRSSGAQMAQFWQGAGQGIQAMPENDPTLDQHPAMQITRGLTKGGLMAAEAMVPYAGLPLMISQAAMESKAAAYNAAVDAKKSPEEAAQIAEDAEVKSMIGAAIFGGQNKLVSSGLAKLLGEGAGPLKTFLVQTLGQTAGNTATSAALSAQEAAANAKQGEKTQAAWDTLAKHFSAQNLEGLSQDVGFGLLGGAHSAMGAKSELAGEQPAQAGKISLADLKFGEEQQTEANPYDQFDAPTQSAPEAQAIPEQPQPAPAAQQPGGDFVDQQIAAGKAMQEFYRQQREQQQQAQQPVQPVTDEAGASQTADVPKPELGNENVNPYDQFDTPTAVAEMRNPEEIAAENEYRQQMQGDLESGDLGTGTQGPELLEAINEAGGLPSKTHSEYGESGYRGELDNLMESSRGARDGGLNGQFFGDLFRKDAPKLDELTQHLRDAGFDVQTPSDVFDLLDQRLRSGRPIYGMEPAGMDIPFSMRPGQTPDPTHRENVDGVIEAAQHGVNRKAWTQLPSPNEQSVRDIIETGGPNISGLPRMTDAFALKHILKQHGDPAAERARGQEPVTVEDLRKIPDLVANPDASAYMGKNSRGQDLMMHVKRDGGWTFYIEEARGKNSLATTSMRKRLATANDATGEPATPLSTSETLRSMAKETLAREIENVKKSNPQLRFQTIPGPDLGGTMSQAAREARAKSWQAGADQFMKRFGVKVPVEVLPDVSARPDDLVMDQARQMSQKGNRVEAFFDPTNPEKPRIVAIASNLADQPQLYRKILHELVGHYGVEQVFRKADADAFYRTMDGLWKKFGSADLGAAWKEEHGYQNFKELAKTYGFDPETRVGKARLVCEHLARLAESDARPNWFKSTVATLREWLRKAVPSLQWSDNDVLHFLDRVRGGLEKGGTGTDEANGTDARFSAAPEMPTLEEAERAAATGEEEKRRFVESVKAAQGIVPEVKDRIADAVYNVFTDKAAVEAAGKRINDIGLDKALTEVLSTDPKRNPATKLTNVMGLDLINRLQAQCRFEEAAQVATHLAETATSQAQALQSLHLLSRLTPEGIQYYTARQIQKALADAPESVKTGYKDLTQLSNQADKARHASATSAIVSIADMLKSQGLDPERLSALQQRLREVLMQSVAEPGIAKSRLIGMLMGPGGMKEADATRTALKAIAEFQKRSAAAREKFLRDLLKVNVPGQQIPKGLIERWLAMNKAGALDDPKLFAEIAKRMKIPVFTPELAAKIKALQAEYARQSDPELKLVAGARMLEAVNETMPVDLWTKIRTIQNFAMLLNPKTAARIVGGNAGMMFLNTVADGISSWAVDPLTSIVTGKRTIGSSGFMERVKGLPQPVVDFQKGMESAKLQGASLKGQFVEGARTMLTLAHLNTSGKFDLHQVDGQFRHVFSTPALRMLEDATTLLHSVTDRSFSEGALRASLHQQMEAARINGQELVAPTPEMVAQARMDMCKALFRDESFLSKGLQKGVKALNWISTFGLTEKWGLGTVILPFTRVPAAILLRGMEWSPAGFVKSSYEVLRPFVRGGEFDQRAFVDAFTRATLGTGMIALGAWLYQRGIVTAAPEENKDIEAMRKSAGLGGYRINFSELKRRMVTGDWSSPFRGPQNGDVIRSYDWLEPAAMPIATGADLAHMRERQDLAESRGKLQVSELTKALIMGAKTIEDKPLLQGLAKFAQDVGTHGFIEGLARQYAATPGAFVPAVVTEARNLRDNTMRETRGGNAMEQELNAVLTKLPWVSERFPAKYDAFGQAQERFQAGTNTAFNVLVNPAFSTMVNQSPIGREVDRVFQATGEAELAKASPTLVTINGKQVQLTNDQLADYRYFTGRFAADMFGRLTASPQFAAMPPEFKAKTMASLLEAGATTAKLALFGQVLDSTTAMVIRKQPPEVQQVMAAAAEQVKTRAAAAMPQYVRPR